MPLRRPCLALLIASSSLPALAAERAEVALVGVHLADLDEGQNAALTAELAAALERGGRFEVVPPEDVGQLLAGREALVLQKAFLGPGEAAYDEGRILYQRAEFDDAMATLQQAVALLREGQPVATDGKVLIDALLLQGLTHFSVGDDAPARAAFEEVVVLDPSRRLDPVNYSGPTVSFFEEVRASVMARGAGAIQVRAEDGAQVYVDSKLRGSGEVTVADLPAGQHAVLVVADGGMRAFQRVQVEAGDTARVDPALEKGFLVAAAPDETERSRQAGLLYAALATYAQADLLLLAGATKASGEVRVQLYDTRTGAWSQSFASSGGDPGAGLLDAAAGLGGYLDEAGALMPDKVAARALPLDVGANALLLDLLLDPEPAAIAGGTTGPVPVVEDERRGVPWWVWAGGGALVAGGAATTAVVLTTGGEAGGSGTIIVGPMP